MLNRTDDFNYVKAQINALITSREDRRIYKNSYTPAYPLLVSDFAEEGLSQTATKLRFPAQFVNELANGDTEHSRLAQEILNMKYEDYFGKDEKVSLFERKFGGKIWAMLSERYAFFDDDEILPIIEKSDYLMNDCAEYWYLVSPKHTHIRFISNNKLHVGEDKSPLSMCVFLDNSMTGFSSFRIRFGLYRWACTNGMISGLKDFEVLRETHTGEKEFREATLEALEEIPMYEKMLIDQVERMQATESMIYEMNEEDALDKIKSYLNTSKKVASRIYGCYLTYGGKTAWNLCNAITEIAHELDLETRLVFERKAFAA